MLNFLSKYPHSPLIDEAIWQLEKLQDKIDESTLLEAVSRQNFRYSIQIGVLSQYSNAFRVQQSLLKKFKTVDIREHVLANSKLYAIMIGEFDTKNKALEFAQQEIKPHLNQFKIIEIGK